MKTAIFPGSFDPFTIGHASIVERALPLFDKVVIGVGVNAGKHPLYPVERRVDFISLLYHEDPRVEVISYDDLTIDTPRLKIPHPLMNQRPFVIEPLKSLINP